MQVCAAFLLEIHVQASGSGCAFEQSLVGQIAEVGRQGQVVEVHLPQPETLGQSTGGFGTNLLLANEIEAALEALKAREVFSRSFFAGTEAGLCVIDGGEALGFSVGHV